VLPILVGGMHEQCKNEGGAAVSRTDRASIEAWYRMECKRLGIEDILSPRVKFI
jgi:hypothetical protein